MRRSPLPLTLALVAALAAGCGGSDQTSPSGSCTLQKTTGAPDSCQNTPGTSAAPAERQTHLGPLQVGETRTFTVPPNTASLTIVQQALSAPASVQYQNPPSAPFTVENIVAPLRVVDPSSRVIYNDLGAIPAGSDPLPSMLAFSQSPSPGMGTLTIPNTTTALNTLVGGSGLTPGTWSVTVSDLAYECTLPNVCCAGGSAASSYDVTVITKPGVTGAATAIPTTGRLDVELWFATTIAPLSNGTPKPINESSAPSDPDVQRMLRTLGTLLGNAGITLGNVGYHKASEQDANPTIDVDLTGGCSDLSNLFRQSTNGNALNVFFVKEFVTSSLDGTGQRVVGSDGTIPGPSTVAGSSASGVAVSTEDLRAGGSFEASNRQTCTSSAITVPNCGADLTAYIVAHELGHYLGLYHTTEADGTSFDTLSTTPTCQCSACAPSSVRNNPSTTVGERCADASPAPSTDRTYQMSISDCTRSTTCGGGDNLMFYVVGNGAQGTLLDEQQRVMRANPLVQ